MRIERRIDELPVDSQSTARLLAVVIERFTKEHGSIGHVALNLAAARMADEVLE